MVNFLNFSKRQRTVYLFKTHLSWYWQLANLFSEISLKLFLYLTQLNIASKHLLQNSPVNFLFYVFLFILWIELLVLFNDSFIKSAEKKENTNPNKCHFICSITKCLELTIFTRFRKAKNLIQFYFSLLVFSAIIPFSFHKRSNTH